MRVSFGHKTRMYFGHRVHTHPSVLPAHQDSARSSHGEDVFVLSPILTPRPASGTTRAGVYCTLCGRQVPIEVSDIASTNRRVLIRRVAAWVGIVVFAAFAAWMLHAMSFVPADERADTRLVWLLGYLPLCVTMLFVLDRLAETDGVRLPETENHELRENPDRDD